MEMDAENNEDESYYLSNSPIRRGNNNIGANNRGIMNKNNKSSALSNNPSSFGQGDVIAGNQQN